MPANIEQVWKIGSACDQIDDALTLGYVPQHADVTAKRSIINTSETVTSATLPRVLTYDCTRHPGVEELVFVTEMKSGRYTLTFHYLHQTHRRIQAGANLEWDGRAEVSWEGRAPVRRDLNHMLLEKWIGQVDAQLDADNPKSIDMPFEEVDEYANQPNAGYFAVEMDGIEVGRGSIAYPHHVNEGEDAYDVRKFSFELVVAQSGVGRIVIRPQMLRSFRDPVNGWFGRHASIRLAPVNVVLEKHAPRLAPQLQEGELPGWHMLDAWGWQTSIWYQQDDPAGKSPEFLHQRAVRDAAKWGANLVELYMSNVAEGRATPFAWGPRDGIDGHEDYREAKHPQWNAETLEKFTRDSHTLGFMQIFYTHYPYRPAEFYRAPNAWTMQLTRKILKRFADPLQQAVQSQIDHLSYESAGSTTSVCQLQLLRTVSDANPGVSFAETNENLGRVLPGLAPHHVGYMTSIARGWDDHAHVPGWLCHESGHLESRWGHSLWGYQLNTRDVQFNRYGDCGPDWLLKQANDYVREGRVKRPDQPLVTAVWAINDSVAACSERNRGYIHAILMDPIRCAIAASFESTGTGGVWRQRCARDDSYFHRTRERFASTDRFIQNNFLRCVFPAGAAEPVLQYDVEGSAHFDQDGTALTLADRMLATVSSAALTDASREFAITESGGNLARLRVSTAWKTNHPVGKLFEQRTINMFNDVPAIVMDLEFEHGGDDQQDIGLVLDCAGYQKMIVDGQTMYEPARFDMTGTSITLVDTEGIRPAMCMVWDETNPFTELDFSPGQRLTLWCKNKKTEVDEKLRRLVYPLHDKSLHARVSMMCQTDKLGVDMLEPAARAMLTHPRFIELNDQPQTIAINPTGVVTISVDGRQQNCPYAVKESGWWRCRPAQPSQVDRGVDYVKLYGVDDDSPVIARSSWFENVVRPGWGCQHGLAIGNIVADGDRVECDVWVRSVSPLIFAPRIQVKKCIATATLDGQAWHYFDDDHFMLPRKTGRFRLCVDMDGACATPHLTRTQAVITRSRHDSGAFEFTAELPAWQRSLPASQHLTAVLEHPGMTVHAVTGGGIVNSEHQRTLFSFMPGSVVVQLEPIMS